MMQIPTKLSSIKNTDDWDNIIEHHITQIASMQSLSEMDINNY